MQIAARILSAVFVPLLMPVYALILVMYIPQDIDFSTFKDSLFMIDERAKKYFLTIFFAMSFVFPAVSIIIMKWTKVIDTIEMDHKRDRYLPYILIAIYGIGLSYLLITLNKTVTISGHLLALSIGCTLISLINLIINTKIKVSAHATGVGILVGFLMVYFFNQPLGSIALIIIAILIGSAVISSRIILNKHTDLELLVGFVNGSAVIILLDLLLINRII